MAASSCERKASASIAYTSELVRAKETLAILCRSLQQHDLPTMMSWRLNERHYGALQGRGKLECCEEFGHERVRTWRNSFDVPPPRVSPHSASHPSTDPKYADVPRALLPSGECLRDTLARAAPFWDAHVAPELRVGRSVLIAAHGHSIRALVKHLDSGVSDAAIERLSVPNCVPLVYHLDEALRPLAPRDAESGLRGAFLGEVAEDWLAVAQQKG